jgi:hypothetical protein
MAGNRLIKNKNYGNAITGNTSSATKIPTTTSPHTLPTTQPNGKWTNYIRKAIHDCHHPVVIADEAHRSQYDFIDQMTLTRENTQCQSKRSWTRRSYWKISGRKVN